MRVHVGPQAERIGAIAFTIGSDIYFAPGRYQPDTVYGRQLLGHELAHVVQQRAGRARNASPFFRTRHSRPKPTASAGVSPRIGVAAQGKMQPAAAQSSAPVRISPPISAGAGTYRLIAGAGGRQVGSVMVHAHDKDTVEVTDLHVAEAQRGQGIGRMLLTSVARTGAQFGRSKVTLAAQDTGTGHLTQWYKGMGFAQVGVNPRGYPRLEAPINRLTGIAQRQEIPCFRRPLRAMLSTGSRTQPGAHSAIIQTARLPGSQFLPDWRRGVQSGFTEGWWEAFDSEYSDAREHIPNLQYAASRAMVGLPDQNVINAIKANPPNVKLDFNDANFAFEHGQLWAKGPGFDEGSFETNKRLNWKRANYPAIPQQAKTNAMAMNNGNCVYCNARPSTDADHVYPVQKHWVTIGCHTGNLDQVNDPSNLVGACQQCNISKSNIYLNQWNGKNWPNGTWFPFANGMGPQANTVIPNRRGNALNPLTW